MRYVTDRNYVRLMILGGLGLNVSDRMLDICSFIFVILYATLSKNMFDSDRD